MIIAWIDSLEGNCFEWRWHWSLLWGVGVADGGGMSWSWLKMKLNKVISTGRDYIGLSLCINTTLLGCGAYDWPELTRIGQTFPHMMHLAGHLPIHDNMLDRQTTPLNPRIIHNRLNGWMLILRPVINIRRINVWCHHWRALNMVDWVVIWGANLCLWHSVPFRRHEGLQVENLVFVLV